MNRLVIVITVLFMGCGQEKETGQHQPAIDIPIQKVLFTRYSKSDHSYNFYQHDLYMVKAGEPKQRKTITSDSTLVTEPIMQQSLYYNTNLLDTYSIDLTVYQNT